MKKALFLIGVISALILILLIPVSAANEFENNDTPFTATHLQLNTPMIGSISDKNDVDWYKITLTEAGTIVFNLRHEAITDWSGSSAQWYLYVYDGDSINGYEADYIQCHYASYSGENHNANAPVVGLDVGTYYVKLTKGYYYSSYEYQLTANYTPTNACEKESNQSINNSTDLELNTEYTGSIYIDDDVDWYKITLTEAGTIVFNLRHEAITDWSRSSSHWYLYVYDGDSINGYEADYIQCLYASYIGENHNANAPVVGLDVGTYYIKLTKGYYHSSYEYKLTANYTSTNACEKESNQSINNSTDLELNTEYTGSIYIDDDVDWYKFTLVDSGRVSVTLTHEAITGWSASSEYWYLYIYDGNSVDGYEAAYIENLYYEYKGNYSGPSDTVNLPAGTYYIKLTDGYYHSSAKYTITVNATLNHIAASAWTTVKDPTCTEPGEQVQLCTSCGDVVTSKIIPALGHSSDNNWEVITAATCAAVGSQNSLCTVCGETITEPIPTLPHSPSGKWETVREAECEKEGEKVKYCKVCNGIAETESTKALDHKFSIRKTISGNIFNMPIVKELTCKYCGITKTESDTSLAWVKPTLTIIVSVVVVGGIIFLVAIKKIKEINDPRLKAMLESRQTAAPAAFGNETPEITPALSASSAPLAFGAVPESQISTSIGTSIIRPPVEVILDPNDNSNILLLDENRNETEFEQVKLVEISGIRYAILKSHGIYNGSPAGELIVFEIKSVLGTEILSVVKDQECVDQILATEN